MAINQRRQLFIREYLVDGNGTQAAIRAGYSERTANEQAARMLADVSVAREVARLQADVIAEVEARVLVTREDVIRNLLAVQDEARNAVKPDHKAAARCWELVGKDMAMFADRLKLELSVEQQERIQQWSDAHGRAVRETLIPALGSDVAEPLMREINRRLRGILEEAE